MEDDVGAVDGTAYVITVEKVAPDDLHTSFGNQRVEGLTVLLAWTGEETDAWWIGKSE